MYIYKHTVLIVGVKDAVMSSAGVRLAENGAAAHVYRGRAAGETLMHIQRYPQVGSRGGVGGGGYGGFFFRLFLRLRRVTEGHILTTPECIRFLGRTFYVVQQCGVYPRSQLMLRMFAC